MEFKSSGTGEKKIKVISLGFGQSNFLGQLYAEIRKQNDNIIIDIDELKKLGKNVDNNEGLAFNKICNFRHHIATSEKIVASFKILFNKYFYVQLFEIILKEKAKLEKIKIFIINSIMAKAVVDKFLIKSNYNIFHFHFCAPFSLAYLFFFPKNIPDDKKIICSFWGSDLLRYNGVFNYYLQNAALKKTDIITTHSPELREIILAKFGRNLKPKIRYTLFNLETRLYDLIDEYRNNSEAKEAFKIKHGISTEYSIVVGHNANYFNNHIGILKQLSKCDVKIKSKITCILPLTYGSIIPNYVADLTAFCEAIDIKCILIKDFLSWEDMALLRLCADIMIHMPESDALSGAATEVMYAGNLLITGTWLPYSPFSRNGLQYIGINEFSDLRDTLLKFVDKQLMLTNEQKTQNIKNIKNYFFPETTSKSWINVYNEIIYG